MSKFMIRPATIKDAEGIFQVHRDAILNIEDYLYSQELKKAWAPENSMRAQNIIQSEEFYTAVAVINKKVVGFGSITGNSLNLLYVDPKFQKQGIATEILEHLEFRLTKPIELKVSKNCVEFYHKLGYKILGKSNSIINNHVIDSFLAAKA